MKKISTIFVIGVSLTLFVACNAQNSPTITEKEKPGLLNGLYWCDESYEKRKNEFIINKDNQPEGSVVVQGHVLKSPQTYIDNKQYDILVFSFTTDQSNQALFNRFSNQRTNDENAKLELGSIENGRLVSTGQLDDETNNKLMNALESGKSISLKLGFNGYPQETGVPPQFTKACKIEAL